jgi:hypothetical protein
LKKNQEAERNTVQMKEQAAITVRRTVQTRQKKKLREVVRAGQEEKQTRISAIAAQQVKTRAPQE